MPPHVSRERRVEIGAGVSDSCASHARVVRLCSVLLMLDFFAVGADSQAAGVSCCTVLRSAVSSAVSTLRPDSVTR
jgi:hypothetical protein